MPEGSRSQPGPLICAGPRICCFPEVRQRVLDSGCAGYRIWTSENSSRSSRHFDEYAPASMPKSGPSPLGGTMEGVDT
jgi:hypothetical protein